MIGFVALRYKETKGHWPLLKKKESSTQLSETEGTSSGEEDGISYPEKAAALGGTTVGVRNVKA